MTSAQYIKSFAFEYLETYSFQRGIEYTTNKKASQAEYDRLNVRKERRNNLTQIEEKRLLEVKELLKVNQYLIDENGRFHPSSKKTNTFQFNDPIVARLISILETEIKEIPSWMCAPTYRDAIVFYSKHNMIISSLNICLSCEVMSSATSRDVSADIETYDLLRNFFLDMGHNIQDTI